MINNLNLEEPFNKVPPDGPLPRLNKLNVLSTQIPQLHRKAPKPWHAPRPEVKKPSLSTIANTALNVSDDNIQPIITPAKRDLSSKSAENFTPSIKISTKSNTSDEVARLKAQLEISQLNEKHLREELLVIHI